MPLTHSSAVDKQAAPHCPQFWLSCLKSTQLPLQFASPLRQAHSPERQVWSCAQDIPHCPQSAGVSLPVVQSWSAQSVPPHVHIESWQMSPWGHAVPQPPQLSTSLLTSMQTPLQIIAGGMHPPQFPSSHAIPLSQTLPQLPQLFGSLVVSTH